MMMTRLMASRLLRSGDRHFTKISREMGKLLTRFLLIRKDFGTPRLFAPFGGKFREDVSRQDCETAKGRKTGPSATALCSTRPDLWRGTGSAESSCGFQSSC